jgi:hypothetical protein
MDPLHPWIDADEVRRLAARLMKPSRDPDVRVADAGFDEGFVGFAANRPAAAVPAPPPGSQPSPPPAVQQPPPAAVPAAVAPPAPEASPAAARGPFLERIRQFRDWMGGRFSASGIFILDREGAVIFDENGHNRLHFLARSLALASRRPGTTAANVHVKIGAATTLEVIPVETAYGCLVLGAVVAEALPPAAVQAVMNALAEIAKPGDPGNAR